MNYLKEERFYTVTGVNNFVAALGVSIRFSTFRHAG